MKQMEEKFYTLEQVRERLAQSQRQIMAGLGLAGEVSPPAAGERECPRLVWDFQLPQQGVLGRWRRRLKLWIRHLTAWQWIPLVETLNRALAGLFQRQAVSEARLRGLQEAMAEEARALAEEKRQGQQQLAEEKRRRVEQFDGWARDLERLSQRQETALARLNEQADRQVAAEENGRAFQSRMEAVQGQLLSRQNLLAQRQDLADAVLTELQGKTAALAAEEAGFRLRRLEMKQPGPPAEDSRIAEAAAAAVSPPAWDRQLFDHCFRGSEEEVSRRQRPYLEEFRGAPGPILDLGCGRGEFLRLLRQSGWAGYGLENDARLAAAGQVAGLPIRLGEGLSHLQSLPAGSLGGILASHLLEHQPRPWVESFFAAAARALAGGARLLVETPNPLSLAGWHGFLLDPDHLRPWHPQYLEFLARQAGFREVAVRFVNPLPQEQQLEEIGEGDLPGRSPEAAWKTAAGQRRNIAKLNQWLFSGQDTLLSARAAGGR